MFLDFQIQVWRKLVFQEVKIGETKYLHLFFQYEYIHGILEENISYIKQ